MKKFCIITLIISIAGVIIISGSFIWNQIKESEHSKIYNNIKNTYVLKNPTYSKIHIDTYMKINYEKEFTNLNETKRSFILHIVLFVAVGMVGVISAIGVSSFDKNE